jgi:hypothetical protein
MRFHRTRDVRVAMPRAALAAIFDECDGFEQDETGGRLIGTFAEQNGKFALSVAGVIEPGPHARRSNVSFFQDGAYQEDIFRRVERDHPKVEHLGNWHSHHVNGYPTLSDGDITTYRRTVNHKNHNTPFFYALLVTERHKSRDPFQRYRVKHYLFRRGDDRAYEIDPRSVEIVDAPLLWPSHDVASADVTAARRADAAIASGPGDVATRPERLLDSDILRDFYGGVRAFASPKVGLFWRGTIELADDSNVQVVVVEDASQRTLTYSILLRQLPGVLKTIAEEIEKQRFASARAALIQAERACNRALFQGLALSRKESSES